MNNLNLLPESYVKQRFRHHVDLLCVVLFAIVMAGVIVTEMVSRRRFHEVQHTHTQVNTKFSGAAGFVNGYFTLQGQRNRLLRKAEIASAMEERIPRSYLLAVVTNARCGTVCLTAMDVDACEVRPDGAEGDMGRKGKKGKTHKSSRKKREQKKTKKETPKRPDVIITIKLQGISETDEDIADFVEILRKSPLLKEVKWRYAKEVRVQVRDESRLCRKFEVKIVVRKNADVLDVIDKEARVASLTTAKQQAPMPVATTKRQVRIAGRRPGTPKPGPAQSAELIIEKEEVLRSRLVGSPARAGEYFSVAGET